MNTNTQKTMEQTIKSIVVGGTVVGITMMLTDLGVKKYLAIGFFAALGAFVIMGKD